MLSLVFNQLAIVEKPNIHADKLVSFGFISLLGNRLATVMLDWRPEIRTAPAITISGNHNRLLAQSAASCEVVPTSKAGQPRVSALKHRARQDWFTVAEDEFALDGSLDATDA